MMYETQADKDNEMKAMNAISHFYTDIQMLPKFSPYDYYGRTHDGEDHIIEYKRRNFTKERFHTVMIPAEKYVNLMNHAGLLGCRPIYLVEWDNGLAWRELTRLVDGEYKEICHRAGRPPQLVVHLKTSSFLPIKTQ